ncbi:amidase [Streptomyces sp. NPDC048057]|uniref:amidase n=1 Tax=Streptomyces sp. NPDC048057 TaxID=3155628 RepID=UPI003409A60D
MTARPLPLDAAARAELDALRTGLAELSGSAHCVLPHPPVARPELPALPEVGPVRPRAAVDPAWAERLDARLGALTWTDWDADFTPDGPLSKVTFGVKENLDVHGRPSRAGRAAAPPPADRDAAAVARLRSAGARLVAGCTMTELAVCLDGNPHRPETRNPRDDTRIAGGSSSGSAVAVAAGFVAAALGTDTGGSVRIPAALCGVVGFKPTYDLLPRDGCVPLAPSLDHVGVITGDTATALAAVLAMAAPGSCTVPAPVRRRVRVGWPVDWTASADPAVNAACRTALAALPDAIEVVPLELPVTTRTSALTNVAVLAAEAATALRPQATDRSTDPRVRALLSAGAFLTADEVRDAHWQRLRITRELRSAFHSVDAIATPTVAVTAPPIGATELPLPDGRTLRWPDVGDHFTAAANSTGFPAVSLPVGPVEGLPVGLQLVAGPHEDAWLLRLAALLEGARG